MHIPELQLNGLTPQQFLDEYWQKKPCLIRQGLGAFAFPLSPNELAGLACDPDVPSRILTEVGGEIGWSLEHGPFDESRFAELPEQGWTLLVSDLEKHVPVTQALIEPFRFIPDWRIDDLMISYAVEGGSVGPHWDDYDVFLVQVAGTREWQIDTSSYCDEDLLPNPDLKILSRFNAETSWLLQPGDILYLPPRVAHHGIARDNDCMTCSVGFRAPAWSDMLTNLVEDISQTQDSDNRYTDPGLRAADVAGQIRTEELNEVRNHLHQLLTLDDTALAHWFGRYITEPSMDWIEESEEIATDTFRTMLSGAMILERSTATRLAWTDDPEGISFFADGQHYSLPGELKQLAVLLCTRHSFDANELLNATHDNHVGFMLLHDLFQRGILQLQQDHDPGF
jgi:50S ribosomal protein L16 3-hydroxylase